MNYRRHPDFKEARIGLTLVICLLVVLGYMTLHYLGGTSQAPTIELRPGYIAEPAPAAEPEMQPQVLSSEPNESTGHALRTSPESGLR